ncbi:hypothetical protein LU674_008770 [Pseudomonas alloputida]|uniref:Uncharacterized protein n=1 Tax=Pseudomonas alloputida TaxID=1940621 RepID=A0AAW7HTG6_9PSED|nr:MULTISPECIES: hypothetical protein [Pseudomonas]MCE0862346.1 hypothetical protein [Pseudomonas alloputida]MCE0891573.1 hypothetical protein [Pseudomonas alloputida]MCE0920694.1 hypothetical protein [Pseudomonas alloputida]MCE1047156.1 hypothetical protein [Pseudomonas alloputida]MCE1127547.1 hypothetical protein [Pseudomonas alloputida]
MTTSISDLGEKVMARLRVIESFASILMENHAFKDDKQRGFEPQLDFHGESAIHEAMYMLADQAQDQLFQLMNAAGGAQ